MQQVLAKAPIVPSRALDRHGTSCRKGRGASQMIRVVNVEVKKQRDLDCHLCCPGSVYKKAMSSAVHECYIPKLHVCSASSSTRAQTTIMPQQNVCSLASTTMKCIMSQRENNSILVQAAKSQYLLKRVPDDLSYEALGCQARQSYSVKSTQRRQPLEEGKLLTAIHGHRKHSPAEAGHPAGQGVGQSLQEEGPCLVLQKSVVRDCKIKIGNNLSVTQFELTPRNVEFCEREVGATTDKYKSIMCACLGMGMHVTGHKGFGQKTALI
eukprot:1158033-Pelagomonas_calceolata.AAC.2